MKWIVFALGLFLAVSGLVAILQGYDIIQVERGWTLVISGTSALGAGIVTIALGIVIARIEALIAVSAPARDISSIDDLASTRVASVLFPAPRVEVASAAPPAAPPPAPAVSPLTGGEKSAASDIASQQEENERDVSLLGLGGAPPQTADEAITPEAEPPGTLSNGARKKARPRATFAMPPLVPAKSVPGPGSWPPGPAGMTEEPVIPTYFSRDFATPPDVAPDFTMKAPITPDFAEETHMIQDFVVAASAMPDHAPPAVASSEHDWLELALAGTEPDSTAAPRTATEAPEFNAASPLAPTAEEEPIGPAVVGRYESNGSSYALFADGSIEAVTVSGIYRFASMAELKEFIERGA